MAKVIPAQEVSAQAVARGGDQQLVVDVVEHKDVRPWRSARSRQGDPPFD